MMSPLHAAQARRRQIWRATVLLFGGLGGGLVALVFGQWMAVSLGAAILIWLLFVLFTIRFFRDPTPQVPDTAGVMVAPAHGTVDCVEETFEPEVMKGPCRRISIFLSIFDVHVQNAPVAGIVELVRHRPGQFLNALKAASAARNENLLIGIRSAERPDEMIGVRLIAGWIARRVVTWAWPGEPVQRGDRIGLIQFGSRCDLYVPLAYQLLTKPGDKVVGGETVLAQRSSLAPVVLVSTKTQTLETS